MQTPKSIYTPAPQLVVRLAMTTNLSPTSGTLSDLIPPEDEQCEAEWVHVFDGVTLDTDMYIQLYCWKPWHPRCEQLRVWRLRHRVERYFEHHIEVGTYWYFMTRSVRNDLNLLNAFRDLRDTQEGFRKHASHNPVEHPFQWSTAWVSVTEITYHPSTGYNVHQHMGIKFPIELTKGLIAYLRDSWSKAAGYPAHFHVRKMSDPARAAAYLAKYMSKSCWGGLSIGRSYLCRDTLKGRNRINVKRGTVIPGHEVKFNLCCLPPTNYCSHPSMVIPEERSVETLREIWDVNP